MPETQSFAPIRVEFVGDPKGQPRPRAFSRGGRARVYDPGTAEGWKSAIAVALRPHVPAAPFRGPVQVHLACFFARPKSHYSARGGLVKSAPPRHVQRPDVDNVAKACLDVCVMLGVIADDAQVIYLVVSKHWHVDHGPSYSVLTIGAS